MYKIYSFLFFTSITLTLIFALVIKDAPYIIPLMLIFALVYFSFILYVILHSIVKINLLIKRPKVLTWVLSKLNLHSDQTAFVGSLLSLVFIATAFLMICFVFVIFVIPFFATPLRNQIASITQGYPTSDENVSFREIDNKLNTLEKKLDLFEYKSTHQTVFLYSDTNYNYRLYIDEAELNNSRSINSIPYNLDICSKNRGGCLITARTILTNYQENEIVDFSVIAKDFPSLNFPIFIVKVSENFGTEMFVYYPSDIYTGKYLDLGESAYAYSSDIKKVTTDPSENKVVFHFSGLNYPGYTFRPTREVILVPDDFGKVQVNRQD